ncbi:MAG TPA: penicillin-binding protein 1A [Steroidobacteraceae bacterium]|nr:penicillin-binding protein 1A [Steroidobacteraceae bacterium]
MLKRYLVLISRICILAVAGAALLAYANVCAYVYLKPSLPNVDTLRNVQLQVPLRVYTRDGRLIASIGEQRRIPVRYDQIPKMLVEAFLAAEDARFFQNHGVDWQGIVRAALADLRAGGVREGGSTITMQVARDVYLSPRRDMKRKLSEIYISLLMEAKYSKEDIFSIYANRTFLGERAYGVGAAAEVYYGKSLDQLSIAEMAMIAGLPKAPSDINPVANPKAARIRRAYVLRRLRDLGDITRAEYLAANASPVATRVHGPTLEVQAPYVAEMVRAALQAKYGDAIYTGGYKVVTTIDSRLQTAARIAVRTGLLEYDRRHGYRGPTGHLRLGAAPLDARALNTGLERFPVVGGLRPAVVESVEPKSALVFVKDLGQITLPWAKIAWARRALPGGNVGRAPASAADVFHRGDVIYTVGTNAQNLQFVQVPQAQSALVAIDPHDGAISALVGGFDYYQSNFNRATQAQRQPGSAFKPFIYAAAFDKGYTPASVVLDAPIVLDDATDAKAWRPKNDANKFYGPTRLRVALVRSRNLVAVRLMRDIGGEYARNYVTRFGFDKSQLPDNLTLALGTADVTPLQLAEAYAPFANGGFRVTSYFIDRVEDGHGKTIFQAHPAIACFECGEQALPPAGALGALVASRPAGTPGATAQAAGTQSSGLDTGEPDGKFLIPPQDLAPQVIRPQVAYLLSDMMADVIRHGTGVRARALGRDDVAGKTGTTNDHRDAWFAGFNGDIVATVWVGFDQDRSLGPGEEGGRTAVPIWTYFMHQALAGVPLRRVPLPDGIVTARIDSQTGLLAGADDPNAIMEKFIAGSLPKPQNAYGKNGTKPVDSEKSIF